MIELIYSKSIYRQLLNINIRDRVLDYFAQYGPEMGFHEFKQFTKSIRRISVQKNSELTALFIKQFSNTFMKFLPSMKLNDIV
jgi:hypothetical protein